MHRTNFPHGIFLLLIFLAVSLILNANIESVQSPDGRLCFEISNTPALSYRILANNERIIDNSAIRMKLEDDINIGYRCKVIKTETETVDEYWNPVISTRRSSIRNHYNELYIEYQEYGRSALIYGIRVRVFNDGLAFRYEFPEQQGIKRFALLNESTQFRFFRDQAICWAPNHGKYVGPQQTAFPERILSGIPEDGLFGLPFIVRQDNHYIALAEAALKDYSGIFLKKTPTTETRLGGVSLKTQLARPTQEETGFLVYKDSLPHQSSWRMIMISDHPVGFYHNDMLLNLNEPCAIKDPSWIKPGISSWDHWWTSEVKMDTRTIKEYIDLAAEMGWEYQLIDWQWYGNFNTPNADITTVNPEVDMEEVRKYAAKKGIRLWLWLYWKDVHHKDAYKKAFPLYKKWGIAGVKIDFMDREDQWMVNWYHKIVKAAGDNHLMVDFHGAYKPTGWRRTYPNLMTREGVEGNEENKWCTDINPPQKCTVAFTRNILGEMDFTPGGFLNQTRESFRKGRPTHVMGTRCQELALFVIYESPFTCACDHPENYRNQPGADFLKIVPVTWDETLGIDGEIGEYITLAKQKEKDWYIAAITNWEERSKTISLDFLDKGKYKATIWKDAEDANTHPQHLEMEILEVSQKDTLKIHLAKGGGTVVHLEKIE